jgi:UDP-N-acetylglucosamine--N-acetylmuramyl-(pentapeptide) pyrophosphoryl-undecaprenol N-acetylglucosamine transferase
MRIVIATGGTGGHIFPARQAAFILRDRGHDVFFIGSLGLFEEKLKQDGFHALSISSKGLSDKSLIGVFKFSLLMKKAIGQSRKALKNIRPDKVIGFGGYGSFAVVLSAKFLSIPTMIHEQNVLPGKANRLLSKIVDKIAISFPDTKKYFDSKKTVWTGCPCQHKKPFGTKESLLKKFSLYPDRKTILILGGSQGSQKINEVFFEMIAAWDHSVPIQAIHMTGSKDYLTCVTKYKNQSLPVKAIEFISPIEEAYAVADVVIARSGAATVSEVGAFAIPSIFIPYPLAHGHQKYNAQVLEKLGLAQIIEQKDLNSDRLKEAIKTFLAYDFDRSAWLKKAAVSFKQSPAQELATAVEAL